MRNVREEEMNKRLSLLRAELSMLHSAAGSDEITYRQFKKLLATVRSHTPFEQ